MTHPRLLVLSLLTELEGHYSADELAQELETRGAVYSRPSIFNVLNDLLDAGLVMMADAGPGRTLYEASKDWHHHFVCRKCGVVSDVDCEVGSKPCISPDLEGYAIDEAQIIFRGLCPDCQ